VRYSVTLDARPGADPMEVDVIEKPDGTIRATVNGRPVEVDAVPIGGHLSVRVDGRVVELTLDGSPPDLRVVANGHRSKVRVESERARSVSKAVTPPSAPGAPVVRSPMPGRIVRVLVAKGATVRPGQGLVVVEAMKMENEVRASAAGVVIEVHVTAGDAVEASAKLVTLG
jgi:glutaconyl-CoA/methylmalonyl-CoA decarboxylase subunit gamma